MMNKSLNGMVKVVAMKGNEGSVSKYRSEIGASYKIPQLFLLDPQGRVTGFVNAGEEDEVKTEAAAVHELVSWQKKSNKAIAKADKDAALGKFKNALLALAKIEKEDAAASAGVERLLKGADAAPASKADAKAEGKYFPKLVAEKREAYEKLAAERLEQAKAKLEKKDTVGARKLLSAMVADGSDLEPVKEATELLASVSGKPGKATAAAK